MHVRKWYPYTIEKYTHVRRSRKWGAHNGRATRDAGLNSPPPESEVLLAQYEELHIRTLQSRHRASADLSKPCVAYHGALTTTTTTTIRGC